MSDGLEVHSDVNGASGGVSERGVMIARPLFFVAQSGLPLKENRACEQRFELKWLRSRRSMSWRGNIFQWTLSALRLKPEAVVFFDDSADNVSAAREVGVDAFQVAGFTELRACLIKLGFLSATER